MKKTKLVIASTLFLCASWVQASVLYDESVSGDLDTTVKHFDLSLGTNSILGSSTFQDPDIVDFDGSFILSLSDGLMLKSIDFLLSNVLVSPSTESLFTSYELTSESRIFHQNIDVLGNLQQSKSVFLIGNQDIGFRHSSMGKEGIGGTWDYEIHFTVSPVPEPTTFLMLLVGLGLIGFVGWRPC